MYNFIFSKSSTLGFKKVISCGRKIAMWKQVCFISDCDHWKLSSFLKKLSCLESILNDSQIICFSSLEPIKSPYWSLAKLLLILKVVTFKKSCYKKVVTKLLLILKCSTFVNKYFRKYFRKYFSKVFSEVFLEVFSKYFRSIFESCYKKSCYKKSCYKKSCY